MRSDLNNEIRSIESGEAVVALNGQGITETTLKALRILDRSPQVGLVFVKGQKSFVAFRREAFESVEGFDTTCTPEELFQRFYDRIKARREWTTVLALHDANRI